MKRALTALISLSVLIACHKNEESKSPDLNAQNTEKLTRTEWCTMSDFEQDVPVVTRYSFKEGSPNTASISYLRLSEDGHPVVYNSQTLKSYTVELTEDPIKMNALMAVSDQPARIREFFDGNTTLRSNANAFVPSMALVLKSAEEPGLTLYPCSAYSDSFAQPAPARSFLDFYLFAGQKRWNASWVADRNTLAPSMSFKFPVEQIKTADVAVAGSSWCSWFLMNDLLTMDIVTIGKGKFAAGYAADVGFEDDQSSMFQSMVDDIKIYTISKNENYLEGGTNLKFSSDGTLIYRSRMFAAIRDADGTVALVRVASTPDSLTSKSFEEIYFQCDDPRPLKDRPAIQKNLPKYLNEQLMKTEQP